MNIITLTLSPAFDIHAKAETLILSHENLATVHRREAGGKGINISRALLANGIRNHAVLLLGEENAKDYCDQLKDQNLNLSILTVPGRIRENLTIHTGNHQETRISFTGFSVFSSVLADIEGILSDYLTADTVLTLTGRLPYGLNMQDVDAFLLHMRHKGVKIVIDSRSFSTEDLIRARPFLIKPNEEEILQYSDHSIKTLDDILLAANDLYKQGIENVMVTLGSLGAILVNSDGTFVADAPSVSVCSTIGAGDAGIAGFLSALSEGLDSTDRLRRAVAFGSAACLREGTEPPHAQDITALLPMIEIKKIQ